MNEIRVPIEIHTNFSHFCDGCKECALTLIWEYSEPLLGCTHKRMCDRLWQDFSERGLVKRKEE